MRRLFTWLMIAFVGVVLLATLTRTVALSISLQDVRADETQEATMTNARAIAGWAQERWERNPAELRPSLATLAQVADARIWLVDTNGLVRVDTQGNPSWEGARLPAEDMTPVRDLKERTLRGHSPWLQSALATVVPVVRDGTVLGAVFLFIPEEAEEPRVAGLLFWSGVAAVALAAVAALLLSRLLARPVEEITRFARTLGEGDFAGEIQVQSVTEVNELAGTLAQVSRQLRASFEAVTEERTRLAAILQSMHEGVLAIDSDGAVILANDAAARMLHWTAIPALPLPVRSLSMPGRLRDALHDALLGETAEVYLRPLGEGDVLAICSPVPSPGRVTGAVAVLRDVEAVLRLQRLRENFVADVAHELRGPLANMSVLAEAMGDGTIRWEDREPFIQALQNEVARLHHLSRDVLDLARMDAGVLAVNVEPVGLQSLAASVVTRLAGRASQARVTLAAAVSDDLLAMASPDRLEQVLFNLAENALRHTPPGGRVTIAAVQEQDRVRITVTDTGNGIPPEHLPRIFERFYKVDPSRTRTDAGTGLGLAVVKQLVELQGGSVEAASQAGCGSVFCVSLANGGSNPRAVQNAAHPQT